MSLDRNTAARDRYTASLVGRQPAGEARVALPAAEAQEALFGWVYKQPGMATVDDCMDLLKRVYAERGAADGEALLQRFGVRRFTDLWIGHYAAFYQYARTVLYYGASPRDGWNSLDDVKPETRDRWLLAHPESDCLWEVRGKLGDELDNGEVEDVSAVDEWERRFAEQITREKETL